MMIRCEIDGVVVECDDESEPGTVEYFETNLARVAGTCLSLYLHTIESPAPIGDEPDDDEPDDDGDGENPPEPIIMFTPDESFDA